MHCNVSRLLPFLSGQEDIVSVTVSLCLLTAELMCMYMYVSIYVYCTEQLLPFHGHHDLLCEMEHLTHNTFFLFEFFGCGCSDSRGYRLRSLCFMYKWNSFTAHPSSMVIYREMGGSHADQQLHDSFIFMGCRMCVQKGNPLLCHFTLGDRAPSCAIS